MGHTDMGTDARVFYIALLSLQSRRQNNLNEFGRRKGNVEPYTPTTSLTPNPSPLGEGLGVRPVVGVGKLGCDCG